MGEALPPVVGESVEMAMLDRGVTLGLDYPAGRNAVISRTS
jgi:hypothetical protein